MGSETTAPQSPLLPVSLFTILTYLWFTDSSNTMLRSLYDQNGGGLEAWLGASLFPSAVMDTDDTAHPPAPVCVCGDSCVAMQGDSWGGGWVEDIAPGDRNRLPLHQTPELGEAAIAEEAGQRLEKPQQRQLQHHKYFMAPELAS